ncbi:MAG: RES family NAD+ phosphorylase [Pseudomonadota bacterium]
MKIVDSKDGQDVLEGLLEGSKPPLPEGIGDLDYLLATPFRYDPRRQGSRFRAVSDPGVYYGAGLVRTAAAELGYWRWRFLQDAVDLDRIEPVAHTAFSVDICTTAIDLRRPPFDQDIAVWKHPADYAGTQAFARAGREAGIGAIVYESVRDPEPAWCLALLQPSGFAMKRPHPGSQTWWLAVSPKEVVWRRDYESMTFSAAHW